MGGAFSENVTGLLVNMEMCHPGPPSRNNWLHSWEESWQLLQVSDSAAESPLAQGPALSEAAHIQ